MLHHRWLHTKIRDSWHDCESIQSGNTSLDKGQRKQLKRNHMIMTQRVIMPGLLARSTHPTSHPHVLVIGPLLSAAWLTKQDYHCCMNMRHNNQHLILIGCQCFLLSNGSPTGWFHCGVHYKSCYCHPLASVQMLPSQLGCQMVEFGNTDNARNEYVLAMLPCFV